MLADFVALNKWVHRARALHYTRLKRFANDKHSSFLGPIVNYEEDEDPRTIIIMFVVWPP
jgi:hypothetical protein